MSNNTLDPQEQAAYREGLEDQARLLGISFRATLSDEKLLARIKAVKEGAPVEAIADEDYEPKKDTKPVDNRISEINLVPQSELEIDPTIIQNERRNKALQMQRVVVNCNDPMKRNWQGELLEAGNSLVGSVKKFVVFGTPWYLPNILIKMIQNKKYQRFYVRKDQYGNEHKYAKQEDAFNVSFVGNLNEVEIAELAKNQMARGDIR